MGIGSCFSDKILIVALTYDMVLVATYAGELQKCIDIITNLMAGGDIGQSMKLLFMKA